MSALVRNLANTFIRYVDSIAALSALPVAAYGRATVTGYYAAGDGGGGNYYYSAASTATVNGGSVVAALGGVGRWLLENAGVMNARVFGAYANNANDDSTVLQTVWSTGGHAGVMPVGTYLFSQGINVTYNITSPAFPIPGAASGRIDVQGESQSNTILAYSGSGYAINLTGSGTNGTGQGLLGLDRIGNFTLQNNAFNASVNDGIYAQNKAWFEIDRVFVQYMNIALNLQSCYFVKVSRFTAGWCNYGIQMTTNAQGACNAVDFDGAVLQNCALAGFYGVAVGSNITFRNGGFESCGTQGNNATGAIVATIGAYGYSGPFTVDNEYFEQNAGVADISLDNDTAAPLTVLVKTATFIRSSNTFYTNSNLSITNSGGGPVNVILQGVNFVSAGNYVPSASRPFWVGGSSAVRFFDMGGNTWNETVSLPQPFFSGRAVAILEFAGATGTATLAEGATVSRSATGTYTVTFNTAALNTNYEPVIVGDRGGNGADGYDITSKTTAGFTFVMSNQAATVFDPTTVSVTVFE
jgi:hypothetical protein